MKRLYIVLLLLIPFVASAQVTLLKNINNLSSVIGSNPKNLVQMGGFVYYNANDGVTGEELWRSDGTVAGTTRVRDIWPGDQGSTPNNFVVVNNQYIYFSANDGDHGYELWRTDGTPKGTIMLSDIQDGSLSGDPNYITNVNNTLVMFTATNGTNGYELWKSDVATRATTMIEDINSGAAGSAPQYITNVNGTVYFSASTAAFGRELWKSDGNTATQVADIISGTASSTPQFLTAFGTDKVLFSASGAQGIEPFVSSGTGASTFQLKDIRSGTSGSNPSGFTTLGTFSYFTANDGTQTELWRTDGSAVNTTMIDVNPTGSSDPDQFTVFGSFVYFNAIATVATGTELYRVSGTTASLAVDINTQTNGHSNPQNLEVFNGALYFNAFTNAAGQELYKFNGTTLSPVFDLLPGTSGSGPKNLCAVGTANLFFSADNGTGQELFKHNGTTATQVVDLVSGSSGSDPEDFIAYNSTQVIFEANDGTGADIWKTDGTTLGTVAFQASGKINPNPTGSANINTMTQVGNTVYFEAMGSDADVELYKYDGINVSKIDVDPSGSINILSMYALNSTTLLFTASATSTGLGFELYKVTNGSSTATLVKDINTGSPSSTPQGFIKYSAAPGFVYFRATTAAAGAELWRTDGTAANTTLVSDIETGTASSNPFYFAELNGSLYFQALKTATGSELYKLTGSTVTLVKDIYTGDSGMPQSLIVYNGDIYFVARSSGFNWELYKMEGATEKVGMLKEINPDPIAGASIDNLFVFNNKLYFTANDLEHGSEMWVTEGTNATTTLFKDMNVGSGSGGFKNPIVIGTKMYFVGTSDTGVDVWVTDGQQCATFGIPFSGSATAGANNLTQIGTKLVFSMNAQGTGREIFLLDPALVTFPTPASINTHPQSKSVALGASTSLTVAAAGTGLTYQWQKASVNINGATSATYNIASAVEADAGDYRVIVTGTCGQVTSNVATLTVTTVAPTSKPSALVISNQAPTSLTVSFTAASPAVSGYLVIRKKGSSPTETPVDGTTYTAGTPLGTATVVRSSAALTGPDAGLENASEYFYSVFSYNGSGALIKYFLDPLKGSGLTVTTEPAVQPTNLVFSNIEGTTLTGSFTAAAGGGGSYIVIRKEGSAPTAVPLDGRNYTAKEVMGDAIVAYAGTEVTFPDTELLAETKYYYMVFFAKSGAASGTINYNQVSPLQNNVTTRVATPGAAATMEFSNIGANTITVSYTGPTPSPAGYLVLRKQGVNPTGAPVDGTTYNSGNTIGDATVAYVGPNNSFIDPVVRNAYTYVVFPYNGAGASTNYNQVNPLSKFTAPDATAPTIDDQTTLSIPAGTAMKIVAAVAEPESSVQQVQLEYVSTSKGGAKTTKLMQLVVDKYEYTVPALEVGDLGIEYTITATNTDAKSSAKTNKVAITYNNQTLPFNSFGSDQKKYRIIAVPLVLSAKTVNEVFGDDLDTYDETKWRMAHYESDQTNDMTGSSLIEPGKGYWLIVKEQKTIDLGAGVIVDAKIDAPFTIDLKVGWNQIGNPYSFNILWSKVMDKSGVNLKLKTYVDGFNEVDRLNKFEGGFVLANAAVTLKFPTEYDGSAGRISAEGPKRLSNSIDQDNWEVMFDVEHANIKNTFGGVGMNRKANIAYDEFDDFTLPRFVEYVELNHRKKLHNIFYTKDVVPTTANHTYEFAVEAESDGATTITWDNSFFGVGDKHLVLWDEKESMPVNMRETNSYSFNQSGRRDFKVFYGSEAYVTEKTSASTILIHNISPNPSYNDMTVTFSIPGTEQTSVEVKVLNTLGQPVAALFKGSLQGGLHSMTWSGKDQQGVRPAQGIYLVEVIANGQKLAKRVVLK